MVVNILRLIPPPSYNFRIKTALIAIYIITLTAQGFSGVNQDAVDNSSLLLACSRCEYAEEMHQIHLAQAVPPTIIRRTNPHYPQEMHAVSGTVILEVTILPDGTIGYLEVKESVPGLDSLAVQAVSEWEFTPAYREDEAVIGFLTVNVDFYPESEAVLDTTVSVKEESPYFHRSDIARYIAEKREIQKHTLLKLSYPSYSENYHLFSPERTMPIISRNNFTIVPAYTNAHNILQGNFPFFEHNIKPHRWNFYTESYDLPITLVDAYLGLGYPEMNYGHLNLIKNDTFSVDGLQFIGSYITEEGYWMGADEKRSNLMGDFYYPFGRYSLRWSSIFVSQLTPAVKFRSLDTPLQSITEESTEHSLYFANPYLDIGLRYERIIYDDQVRKPERRLYHLNLKRSFRYKDHSLQLQGEAFQVDKNSFQTTPFLTADRDNLFTGDYDFDTKLMYLNANVISGLGYKYRAMSEAGYKIGRALQWGIGYVEAEREDIDLLSLQEGDLFPNNHYFHQEIEKDIYTVIKIKPTAKTSYFHTFTPRIGMQQIAQTSYLIPQEENGGIRDDAILPGVVYDEEVETLYLRNDYSVGWSMGRLDCFLYGFGQYYHKTDDMWYLPELFVRNTLEFHYRLPHKNVISLGFSNHFSTDYKPLTDYDRQTSLLDGFVRISITDLFDIQADVMNILETETMYGIPSKAGLHFNAGIRWLFFN